MELSSAGDELKGNYSSGRCRWNHVNKLILHLIISRIFAQNLSRFSFFKWEQWKEDVSVLKYFWNQLVVDPKEVIRY